VKQLLFHPQAEEELEDPARYYESKGKGLSHIRNIRPDLVAL
jgi:hypothetical protein